jgi:hypothetical protein
MHPVGEISPHHVEQPSQACLDIDLQEDTGAVGEKSPQSPLIMFLSRMRFSILVRLILWMKRSLIMFLLRLRLCNHHRLVSRSLLKLNFTILAFVYNVPCLISSVFYIDKMKSPLVVFPLWMRKIVSLLTRMWERMSPFIMLLWRMGKIQSR